MNFLRDIWAAAVTTLRPGVLELYGVAILQIAFLFIPSVVLSLLPLWCPPSLRPSRVTTSLEVIHWGFFYKASALSLLNQMTVLAGYALILYPVKYSVGFFVVRAELPHLADFMWQIPAICLLREIIFYAAHWLMHRPVFMRWFHYVHHSFGDLTALCVSYNHPVDYIVMNAMPIALPGMILRAHVLTQYLFSAYCMLDAVLAHSGYSFFRVPGVEEHEIHHMKGKGNLGIYGPLDRILGTMSVEKASF